MTSILGISAFYHDSAAALVIDGEIVAAAQEERFSRKKHDQEFPKQAIRYCLDEAGLSAEQLDYVGFYDKPVLKFERLLETYLSYAPRGFRSFSRAMPLWLNQKLHLPRELKRGLGGKFDKRILFSKHHESHAASAFFPSPFEEAAILTLDGVGEWATASYGIGRGNRIELSHELHFPHSLGLLYSAFTQYCGFEVNGGEYKVMGLAPFGQPLYVDRILEDLMDLKDDGSFRMRMRYFNYAQGLSMTSEDFHRLFEGPPRKPGAPLEQRHMDLAASVQRVTEEIMLRAARHVHRETGLSRLCLAGGVALNCVGNGQILRKGPFEDIWIQPAADDAGGALGVALLIWHQLLDKPRPVTGSDSQRGSALGKAYEAEEIEAFLGEVGAHYTRMDDESQLCDTVATAIDRGEVVGWFQGRMEFGPRALGSRSILGDARNPQMQKIINQKVKFREDFRPFAPIVLKEHAHRYFDIRPEQESPYMSLVAPLLQDRRIETSGEMPRTGLEKLDAPRSEIPAVTHVDYSARIQTVDPSRHGLLHRLLESFYEKTGCPVMVNTSFNLGWSPIVGSLEDAYTTFMMSELDLLCVGPFLVRKDQATPPREGSSTKTPDFLDDLLRSPCCNAALERSPDTLVCVECAHSFPVEDGIPLLFWPSKPEDDSQDVTEIVKSFYEDNPFPNYDEHDSLRSLIDKSRRGRYAWQLNNSIPFDAKVLEVGCGTGQLTNLLGASFRQVVGTDMCLNSLRLADQFRRDHELDRVRFIQMNLFRPTLTSQQFDVVLCNGVLHHTADPYGGFESILPLVRPGGHIVIGLYNRYGRLLTDLRRQFFRFTQDRGRWIDPVLRGLGSGAQQSRSWYADQYRNPHESKHTSDEILGWFACNGIEFLRGVPAMRLDEDGLGGATLFEEQPVGSRLDRLVSQWAQILGAGQREGGFFVMIGRKPEAAESSPDTAGHRHEDSASKKPRMPLRRDGEDPWH